MRNRLLSLLMLVMLVTTGAWTQEEVPLTSLGNGAWFLPMPSFDTELVVEYYTDDDFLTDGIPLTKTGNGEWTLEAMPGFDVELVVEYYSDDDFLADGFPLTKTGDSEWTLESMPGFDVELVVEYETVLGLNDGGDNTEALNDWNNCEADAILLGRTLYKDGSWNTLCLPFDVENFSGSPLEGATVMTLGNSAGCNTGFSNGTLTLDFVPANSIEAGHAYIVRWETTGNDIVNPTFTGVTISNEYPTEQSVVSSDGRVQFRGTYNPVNIYTAAKKSLYLGDDGKLHSPNADMTLNAFRAYFQLSSTSEGTGDVNGDGSITIADVTALVNIILGKEGTYNDGAADVNGDGTITIADVTALVNIILGKDSIILNNVTVTGADGITFEK